MHSIIFSLFARALISTKILLLETNKFIELLESCPQLLLALIDIELEGFHRILVYLILKTLQSTKQSIGLHRKLPIHVRPPRRAQLQASS